MKSKVRQNSLEEEHKQKRPFRRPRDAQQRVREPAESPLLRLPLELIFRVFLESYNPGLAVSCKALAAVFRQAPTHIRAAYVLDAYDDAWENGVRRKYNEQQGVCSCHNGPTGYHNSWSGAANFPCLDYATAIHLSERLSSRLKKFRPCTTACPQRNSKSIDNTNAEGGEQIHFWVGSPAAEYLEPDMQNTSMLKRVVRPSPIILMPKILLESPP